MQFCLKLETPTFSCPCRRSCQSPAGEQWFVGGCDHPDRAERVNQSSRLVRVEIEWLDWSIIILGTWLFLSRCCPPPPPTPPVHGPLHLRGYCSCNDPPCLELCAQQQTCLTYTMTPAPSLAAWRPVEHDQLGTKPECRTSIMPPPPHLRPAFFLPPLTRHPSLSVSIRSATFHWLSSLTHPPKPPSSSCYYHPSLDADALSPPPPLCFY